MENKNSRMSGIKKGTIKRIVKYITKSYKKHMLLVFVCIIFSSVIGVIGSLFLKTLIDSFPVELKLDNSSADLNIGDSEGNVILRLQDGHIKTKNFDYNIRFKNVDRDFIKELFGLDEFIAFHSKDQLFYCAFCNTKLFANYFREKIYANNDLDSVRHEQFDQFIYLKKHKDTRKKKENN